MLDRRVCKRYHGGNTANPSKHEIKLFVEQHDMLFVEQLHSRGVFWRIRGGLPSGAAGGAAAVGLGDS